MKKQVLIGLLLLLLVLTGCEKEAVKIPETDSSNNMNSLEIPNDIKQFYDESRLNKSQEYTMENIGDRFSFVQTYYDYANEEDYLGTKIEEIYSYTGGNENIQFRSNSDETYYFNYITPDAVYEYEYLDISVSSTDYTKDNYRDLIQEYNDNEYSDSDKVIIKEEDNYVFLKEETNYSVNYTLIKFFDNGRSLVAEHYYYQSDSETIDNELVYEYMKNLFEMIVLDNKDAILQDKIVSFLNYKKKKIRSYEWISSVSVVEGTITLSYNNKSLDLAFDSDGYRYYMDGVWNIVSKENPYIVANVEESTYKVVVDGKPEYYHYTEYSYDEETKPAIEVDGSLATLDKIINYFYK